MKPNKVKEDDEAMMAVAAKQLKSAGSFKIAGAFNMKLKTRRKHVASNGRNKQTSQTVRGSPLKNVKELVIYCA